jgi:CheY-like chemotaxis protein
MNQPRARLQILVVEDEALLAMDIEAMIEDCGHAIVAEAASLHDVAELNDDVAPDIAFVDMHLARGTCGLDVSALIQERWGDTVIIFVTANPKKIPADFAGAHGVIPKPFSRAGLMSAMRYIEEGVCSPPPTMPRPVSFVASPACAASWN